MSIIRTLRAATLLAVVPLALSAQADLEKMVKADSNNPVGHYTLALSYWKDKKWPDAERELKEALALEPRYAGAQIAMAAVPFAKRKSLWNETLSGTGVPGGSAADLAESDKHYKLAFFLDPAVDMAIFGTVATVSDNSDFGKGVVACHQARYADRNSLLALYFQGRKSDTKKIPKAAYWYQGVAATHAKDIATAGGAWGTISNRKEDDTREVISDDVARIPLKTSDLDFEIGVLSYKLGGGAGEAMSVFQRVADTDPSNFMAHVYLANIYEGQKNFDKAVSEREAAIKTGTDDIKVHYELGSTLVNAKKFAEAVPHLDKATSQMPRSARVWYTLGLAKDGAGDAAGAKAAYTKAVANLSGADPAAFAAAVKTAAAK